MEIKEPKFREGQKVKYVEDRNVYTIESINSYSFKRNEYQYNLLERLCTLPESALELYTEKPKSVWDLKEGDTYYSIYGNGNVSSEKKWFDDDYENNYREIGNVFLTKEEAEFDVERRKIETEMLRLGGRRKINELNNDVVYTIQMHFGLKYVYVRSFDIKQAPIGVIFFNYRKQAIKALETIGEYRIKKYIFGVDE